MAYPVKDTERWCKCPDSDAVLHCFQQPTPSVNELRRTFTALTMYLFSSTDNMEASFREPLACRTFSPDATATKIHIQAQSALDPADTESIPAILISVKDGVKFERLAMGDEHTEGPDFARRTKVWRASADITFLCRDWDADVVCMEADLLTLYLSFLQQKLMGHWTWLMDYYPMTMTEPVLKTDGDDSNATKWYESTVVIHLDYTYAMETSEESVPLRHVTVDAVGAGMEGGFAAHPTTLVPASGIPYRP